jgi:hypothetical protein
MNNSNKISLIAQIYNKLMVFTSKKISLLFQVNKNMIFASCIHKYGLFVGSTE